MALVKAREASGEEKEDWLLLEAWEWSKRQKTPKGKHISSSVD